MSGFFVDPEEFLQTYYDKSSFLSCGINHFLKRLPFGKIHLMAGPMPCYAIGPTHRDYDWNKTHIYLEGLYPLGLAVNTEAGIEIFLRRSSLPFGLEGEIDFHAYLHDCSTPVYSTRYMLTFGMLFGNQK